MSVGVGGRSHCGERRIRVKSLLLLLLWLVHGQPSAAFKWLSLPGDAWLDGHVYTPDRIFPGVFCEQVNIQNVMTLCSRQSDRCLLHTPGSSLTGYLSALTLTLAKM